MIISFHPCIVADHQIILGDRTLNPGDRRLIEKAELIILPQTCSEELYQACKASSSQLFPNYEAKFRYPGKMGQILLFQESNLPYPKSLLCSNTNEFRMVRESHKVSLPAFPFFIKRNEGHEAEGVELIRDEVSLESCLSRLSHLDTVGRSGFIIQELIPSEGNVLRVVILGYRFIAYWKRTMEKGEIIATISRGANIDYDWRPDLREKGEIQARRLSDVTGINLAAIDFVFSFSEVDPQPLFLEINYYFARRGLGGSSAYYRLLFEALQEWLSGHGFDPDSVSLV